MSNKVEEEQDDSKKIGSGDLLSFGSVNLLFTLNLEKEDLSTYKIKWNELESLTDLSFIRENKELWKRIELTSTSDTLSILLQINKSSKKKIKIGYVGLKRITYKDEQVEFVDFIEGVTRKNGLYLTSCDVCKSIVSIQLLLKYKNKQKIFLLSGVSTPITKDNEKEENKNKENNNNINKKEIAKNNEDENINNEEKKNNEVENENGTKNNNNEEIKKEKENKSEEEDQDNPFSNITDDVINPGEFNYIYFNYCDFSSGEFNKSIKIEHLYEFFQNLKVTTKSKIILNLNQEKINNKEDNIKDLLSLTDIYIFYNKNKLYDILKQMKENEDQSELKKLYNLHLSEIKRKYEEKEEFKEKEEKYIEKYKNFLEKEKLQKERRINHSVKREKINFNSNIYLTQNNSGINKINQLINVTEENHKNSSQPKTLESNKIGSKTELNNEFIKKNQTIENNKSSYLNLKNIKIKLTPITPTKPTPLNKKDMFEYFKCGICDKDPMKKPNEKTALVLDEFKKIFFIKCNKKNEKPSVLDFDLKLYPQMNLRNMKEILESKKFIQSNFSDYINAFFGSVLSTIVSKGQEGCEEKSLFLSYLLATNTIKKMVEIQKYNLPMPKSKDFFSSSINKVEVKKMLTEANKRKKEQLFILDGNSKKNDFIKPYNPLLDRNLASYFASKNNQHFLRMKGFIGKEGEIMYDPIYRETLITNTNPRNTRFNTFENRKPFNSAQKKKIKKNKLNKNNRFDKYKTMTTNKFLFGFRKKSPGYSIYNQTGKNGIVLPPISHEKKHFKKNEKVKCKSKEEFEEESDGSGSRSGHEDDNDNGN